MIISQSTINTYHDHLVSENKLKEVGYKNDNLFWRKI